MKIILNIFIFYIIQVCFCACPDEYFTKPDKPGWCFWCWAGSYHEPTTNDCKRCPAGTYSPSQNAKTYCFECSAGTYSNQKNNTECKI